MQRNLDELANREFDVLVIGGGIYGATVAWDAVLRGLSVALIDKRDFAAATSGNSLKIIHGGLRYLQHGDLKRMRESISERRIMMNIAPQFIFPLPCVMPTFRHGVKGPEIMRIALLLSDLIGYDRNRLYDPLKKLPRGRVLSKQQILEIIPFVDQENLTGGALWYDAQMYNSERLTLAFIHSAVEQGAQVANYVQADQFVFKNGRLTGAKVSDVLTGQDFEIRARMTINTAGPWLNNLLSSLNGKYRRGRIAFSTAVNLVINKPLSSFAFGAPAKTEYRDKDAIISRGSRLLFVVPWRGVSLVGTAHKPYYGEADQYRLSEQELQDFLAEINRALPGSPIDRKDVTFFNAGLLPMTGVNLESGNVRLQKHFKIYDHETEDGIPGLLSVLSVKYTTARGVAASAVDLSVKKLGKGMRSRSALVPIWGGDVAEISSFIQSEVVRHRPRFAEQAVRHLIANYGTKYSKVIELIDRFPELGNPITPASEILAAEVIYGVRYEMAQTLPDLILRRTELGTKGLPSDDEIRACADLMACEMGWDSSKITSEMNTLKDLYRTI